jgi:hypothetical protein
MFPDGGYLFVSILISVMHVAVVWWCAFKLPKRDINPLAKTAVYLLFIACSYEFGLVYHARVFIDATLINIVLCVLFILALHSCGIRIAVLFGTIITICYESARALVLYCALEYLSISIAVFEADQFLRILVDLIGTAIALSSLWILHNRANDLKDEMVRPIYFVALLQPLVVMVIINVWRMPVVDNQIPACSFSPIVIMAALEVGVVASAMLVMFAFTSNQRKEEAHRLESLIESQHDALMMRTKSDDAVDRIAHDIKNHLICLQELDSSKQIEDHLQGINEQLFALKKFPYTSNSALDIVLNEKASTAHAMGIDFIVLVDFSQGGFLRSVDICAIFGNAIDNALRAVSKVQDKEKRAVTIKCTVVSGFLTIRINNYFCDEIKWRDGRLLSSRRQWRAPGFGMRSIEHSASRYGGTVRVEQNKDEFSLIVLIPVPQKDESHS